jgi:RsiW-degrading membrane proteinase PrsW (M82 family)
VACRLTIADMAMLVTDKKSRPISATISIVATILTLGYMLPWMIAALRGKSNAWGVFVVNLLLGWTVLGWIIALVMSCTSHQVAGYGLRAPRR